MFRICRHKQLTISRRSTVVLGSGSAQLSISFAFSAHFSVCSSIVSYPELLGIQHTQSMRMSLLRSIHSGYTLEQECSLYCVFADYI